MRFSPPFWKTIYWGVFTQIPGELLFFHSPTVKLYGVSLGTDKMGHFFQEGHQYYERYFEVLDRGETPEQAHDEAVAIGQGEEHGIDGSAIDGVFSNGDLAANYAGFKFYSNLAHPIQIGSETLEPMLRFEGGRWVYARPLDPESLLKPFISEHLNEALNPSRYKFSKWLIRWHVRDRCATWREQFPSITHESETTRLKALASWYGEDYGHWLPDGDLISLTTECYP